MNQATKQRPFTNYLPMDAKKDILFIMNDLHGGGAQKALISLLQAMDYSKFDIDLLLLRHEGVFLDQLPGQVRLLPVTESYRIFNMPIVSAIADCLKKGKINTLVNRMLSVWVLKTERNPAVREQKMWRFLSPSLESVAKKYDVAVGFLEKTPNYFCIDKTLAAQKILWIHTNYSNMGMLPKYDRRYFEKADFIAAVSDQCANDLQKHFPEFSGKIKTVPNIVSPAIIKQMADEAVPEQIPRHTIVTVGRLSHEKGIDLAIEACKLLSDKGIEFIWYFIGDGTQRKDLEDLTANYRLEGKVVFLGEKANPYPYVKKAAVYAQTSRFEGKSIAIDEARILHSPILATDFSTVHSQIRHLENGYIAAMNPQSIAEGIAALLSDGALRERFRSNLAGEKPAAESGIAHFYQLIQ